MLGFSCFIVTKKNHGKFLMLHDNVFHILWKHME